MLKLSLIIRSFKKNISLKLVSIIGLSLAFACCLLVYAFSYFEFSYDKFHNNAEDIYRLTYNKTEELSDARIYGKPENMFSEISEIDKVVKLQKKQ